MSGERQGTRTARTARTAAVPVDLLLARAERQLQQGDATGAEQTFRDVLAAYPYDERATQMLGASLAQRNQLDAAIDLFEAAEPHVGAPSAATFGFYNNYANALRRAGRLTSAERILRELVASAPRAWEAWHNLGQTLRDAKRYDEAAAALRRAVTLAPDYGPNHGVLGEVLHHLGRLHSAQRSLRRAIDLGCGNDHTIWTVLGNNQRMLGELDEALDMVMRSLALCGGTPAAHSNAGVVLMQLGRFDEAIAHFELAIAGEPDNNGFHGYLGYALLASGRIADAIEPWNRGILGGLRGTERELGVERWTPADADCRVMVYREQGVGDEIMLASMYPDLIAAAREVVIECDPRLVPLFTRSFPGAEVRAQTYDPLRKETTDDVDRAIAACGLIGWFRPSVDAFPDRRSYLAADPARVDAWRERLADLGPGPYVGISWRSKVQTAERRLEYTRLDEWHDILTVPGVTFVNLQYDECSHEIYDAEQQFGVRIHRWDELDLMNDFDEVAALTTALDLVVAPFNAVSMLSGALGVRTFAMGRKYTWGPLGTDGLPWLPAVTAALRSPNESWEQILPRAAAQVADVAARRRTSEEQR